MRARIPTPPVATLVAVTLAWLVTRAVVVWLLRGPHSWVEGDLAYYAAGLAAVPDVGLAHTLVEYPLPGVLVVAVPWLLVTLLGEPASYPAAVLAVSLAADAAFTGLLARSARAGRGAALAVWLLAVPLLGATTFARFDLVPGLLAGAAVLLVARHPGAAAAAGSLATGFKLWPVLVLPALALREAGRRTVLVVVLLTGSALAVGTLLVGGWSRLLSPLGWQADRGLQVESVAATPAMVGWALRPGRYDVAFTDHNAFEVDGPGVTALLLAAEVTSLLVLPLLCGIWWVALRRVHAPAAERVAWVALAAVGLFLVTSKVLSPQYLLWLLPLAAAAVGTTSDRRLRVWAGGLLAATAATQVVFPVLYGSLVEPGPLTGTAVLVLTVRNLLLVALTGAAVAGAVGGGEVPPGRQRGRALERHPPGPAG